MPPTPTAHIATPQDVASDGCCSKWVHTPMQHMGKTIRMTSSWKCIDHQVTSRAQQRKRMSLFCECGFHLGVVCHLRHRTSPLLWVKITLQQPGASILSHFASTRTLTPPGRAIETSPQRATSTSRSSATFTFIGSRQRVGSLDSDLKHVRHHTPHTPPPPLGQTK